MTLCSGMAFSLKFSSLLRISSDMSPISPLWALPLRSGKPLTTIYASPIVSTCTVEQVEYLCFNITCFPVFVSVLTLRIFVIRVQHIIDVHVVWCASAVCIIIRNEKKTVSMSIFCYRTIAKNYIKQATRRLIINYGRVVIKSVRKTFRLYWM